MAIPPNPTNPVGATFPLAPPNANLPLVDSRGYPTIYFFQFLQLVYAIIQGGGGIIDMLATIDGQPVIKNDPVIYWTPVPTATDLILTGYPSQNLLLTGTDTVATLGLGRNGDSKNIRAQDGFTFTASGSLILPNDGLDLRLLAGDSCTVLCGTNSVWTVEGVTPYLNVVPNYDALRALTVTTTTFFVQGFSTPDDGGQGWFAYDPGDTTSVDNNGTILVAGDNRWKRVYEGGAYPQWFGAAVDGVTDDIDAWNFLAASVNDGTIKAIAVDGISCIGGSITPFTKGLALSGTSSRTSGLSQISGTGNLLEFTALGTADQVNVNNVGLFSQQANLGQAMKIAYITGSARPSINMSNVEIHARMGGGFNRGIELVNACVCTFGNVVFTGYQGGGGGFPAQNLQSAWGWYIHSSAHGMNLFCVDLRWSNCECLAVQLGWRGEDHIEGATWHQCIATFLGAAWDIQLSDTTEAPYFAWVDCQTECITGSSVKVVNASQITIADCIFYRNASATGSDTQILIQDSTEVDVHDSNILMIGSSGTGVAVQLDNVNWAKVHDCLINNFNSYGVVFTGTSDTCREYDNQYVSMSFATYTNAASSPHNQTNTGGRRTLTSVPSSVDLVNTSASNTTASVITNTTTYPTSSFVQVPIPLNEGERIQVNIYASCGSGFGQAELNARIREITHRPGTVSPFNVIQYTPSNNNWINSYVVGDGVSVIYMSNIFPVQTVVFDVIANAPDAVISLDLWTNGNNANFITAEVQIEKL